MRQRAPSAPPAPGGRFPVTVAVDATDAVSEEDEVNNQATIELGVPPAPADLHAGVSNRGGAVFLRWTAPDTGIDHYRIYRATADESFRLVGQTSTPAYVDLGMANGVQHRYVVTAVDGSDVESPRSNEVWATPAWPYRLYVPLLGR